MTAHPPAGPSASPCDQYLAEFDRLELAVRGHEPAWLRELRRAAVGRFAALGFPTTAQEEWKYTSLLPLTRTAFAPAEPTDGREAGARLPHALIGGDVGPCRAVFVNGDASGPVALSGALPDGVRVARLRDVLATTPETVAPFLARYASFADQPVVALNTALFRDGAVVMVPPGRIVAEPIHLVFVSLPNGAPTMSFPRVLILVGAGAQVRIVEHYRGPAGSVAFTDAVTEAIVEEGAGLDHYKVQRESEATVHLGRVQVHQGRESRVTSHSLAFGGALARTEIATVLGGVGATCTLNGLFVVRDRQHVDNQTVIDHAQPHGSSRECYKGILDGTARGVFNGKIIVRRDAQKTDAFQTNKNLLLSEGAMMNTKPQLEILADDVKCSHGATIGQLDADALFYLRSRGLGDAMARRLLTYAFASEIVGQIAVAPIRDTLEQALGARWLPGAVPMEAA